ncbi:NHLP bacteriocin system secretion protein [Planktothrix sp. FACHB-1355]|uniref:NHLP bacteriocin system secretion protein n=1 Tax=Aerosakkonema funiforme FACHB-1375 TaxID=2949571 RepID=A0A926VFZ3_9CYAN|nr:MULTISPECIES: NHLP bacteriocin system secretion protein [Oscillatoriales]MBD2181934.1 NHLP bacteriocin system secretion protein [Aerosakkonema funiforme FACHB-1375]MBD3560186.1 NHLP bacteriocin system secretion protein [Planktothrix sp. FACHB-1355]
MTEEKKNIFRKESLNRLSSPERLDELMQVVNPQDWLPLTALGGLVFVALFWSIFGRIPITVSGQGVILRSRQVVEIQSPISGQIQDLKVKVGDCVKKDNGDDINDPEEILAVVDPLELKQKRQLEVAKLQELQRQDLQATTIALQRRQLEKAELQQQRTSLQQRLKDTQALTPLLKTESTVSIQQQRENLLKRLQDMQTLTPVLKNKRSDSIKQQRVSLQQRLRDAQAKAPILQERVKRRQELLNEGAIAADRVLEAEQEYTDSLQRVSEIQTQLKQLDVDEAQAEQGYLDNLSKISEIQTQLKQLDLQQTEAEQKYLENLNKISEIQTNLKELDTKDKSLEQQNLEATNTRKNQILNSEQEIKRLEQQIQTNSTIKVPYSGCILELTVTGGQVVNPGTRIGSIQIEKPNEPLLAITYFGIKDGKQVKSGMAMQITPTTVKRERFGGIVGTVISVSPFPVTKEGAASTIGNPELVESLMSQSKESQIEVWAKLKENPANFSGYEWSSSKGPPDLKISTGTTTTVQVTVDKRAPIEFILPFLREWSGIN